MHSKSNNKEFMAYANANDIVDERLDSLLSSYQISLVASMRGSNFIFDSVQLLYYKCHNIDFKRDGSYNDSQDWIKKKKATINPKYGENKYFQYAATVPLNYGEIELQPERLQILNH